MGDAQPAEDLGSAYVAINYVDGPPKYLSVPVGHELEGEIFTYEDVVASIAAAMEGGDEGFVMFETIGGKGKPSAALIRMKYVTNITAEFRHAE